jgi:cytochrome c-type biogenesis protein CcmH/NrfG
VAVNPTNIDAWTQLGNVYFDTQNFTKAIRAYEKSLELSPNNPNVLTDLGVMYRRNGQPGKAVEVFDRAMTIDPRHEQSRFNKGIVLRYDMNDREGAVKAWEELLRINPSATAPNGQPLSEAIKSL